MKTSFKLFLGMALSLILTSAVSAQRPHEPRDPAKMAERQTERIVDKLDLDDAQAVKVQALNLEFAEKIAEAHKAQEESMRKIREEFRTAHAEEMKSILTKEQFTEFSSMEFRPNRGERGAEGRGIKGGERKGPKGEGRKGIKGSDEKGNPDNR